MMSGLCTYMNTARASLSVLWPQCSCCKWGHPRSLEVTRGHQSPAWAEVARGPEAVNTHSASSLGAHSAISGLSLGPACSLPPPSLWAHPGRGAEAAVLNVQAGPRAAAGQMSRRGQRLVSPGRESSAHWSPGPRHRAEWDSGARGSLHCIIVTLSRITLQSSAHHYSLSLSHLNQESLT